jgi:hypothetical protein
MNIDRPLRGRLRGRDGHDGDLDFGSFGLIDRRLSASAYGWRILMTAAVRRIGMGDFDQAASGLGWRDRQHS